MSNIQPKKQYSKLEMKGRTTRLYIKISLFDTALVMKIPEVSIQHFENNNFLRDMAQLAPPPPLPSKEYFTRKKIKVNK